MQLCTSWGYERFSISQHVPSWKTHFYRWETTMRKHGEIHVNPRNSSPLFVATVQKWACPGAKGRYAPGKRHWMTKITCWHWKWSNQSSWFPFGNMCLKTLNLWYYHRWTCWKHQHPNYHWAMSSQPLCDGSIPNFGIVKQSNTWNDSSKCIQLLDVSLQHCQKR